LIFGIKKIQTEVGGRESGEVAIPGGDGVINVPSAGGEWVAGSDFAIRLW
jgi:hypothetical protein